MLRFTNVDHPSVRLPPIYGYRTHPILPLREALDPLLSQIDELDHFIKVAKCECYYPSEDGLTRDESASIYIYTMDWGEQSLYRVLNAALRVEDRSVLVPWHGYLKLFDTALKKLPSYCGNLWRGVNCDIAQNFQKDKGLTWWQFASCSSSVKNVKQFLGPVSTLFMVEAKNGKAISRYSNFPHEEEVILKLCTQLRVVSDPLDHQALNVVHLVELLDQNNEDEDNFSPSLANITVTESVSDAFANNSSSKFKVCIYSGGSRYEGECQDEKKHGKGTYHFDNGNEYTGDWVNGKKEGLGVFTWKTGDRYKTRYS